MDENNFDAELNELYSEVAGFEHVAENVVDGSKSEVISKVSDFSELSSLQDDCWLKYMALSELEEGLHNRLIEILDLGRKAFTEQLELLRSFLSLSIRAGMAATAILGAYRRIENRKSELIEQQKSEIARLKEYEDAFYDMVPPMGGPGGEEE